MLNDCVVSSVSAKEKGDDLLRVMKALPFLLKFVVRSRQLFADLLDTNGNGEEEDDFESLLSTLLTSMSDFLKKNDGLVLLAQGACLKYLPCAIPDLLLVYDEKQLR